MWQEAIRYRASSLGSSSVLGARIHVLVLRLAPVVALFALAAAFRVLDIGRVGLNSDEAVYSGQAATLIGDATMGEFFSVFRAHPLFLQLSLGGLFAIFGVSDIVARLFVALVFGAGAVVLTYLLAKRLYGGRVAFVAGAILAVLPYHIMVSRQVLVDIPMAFFTLLTLWFVAGSRDDPSGRWLPWAALAAGLAVISKEVAILLLPMMGAFLIVTGRWRRLPLRRVLIGAALFALVVAPYVVSRLLLAPYEGPGYLLWQLGRPPNHDSWYFLRVLGEFGGLAFGVLALLGLVRMLRARPGDILILLWLAVFCAFFQLWPTKLFQYLVVVVPALSIGAALGLEAAARVVVNAVRPALGLRIATGTAIAVALLGLSLVQANSALAMIHRGPEAVAGPLQFDIEVQDFAGGRELGYWAKENTPPEARFLTIGPSIGNILRFYGHRDSVALSISSDPRLRNPAYIPVANPDLWIRQGGIHYIVWDAYSADRSAFYNARLMRYARRSGSIVIHAIYQRPDGGLFVGTDPPPGLEARILVYDVVGGDRLSR